MTDLRKVAGGCQCGAVRYEAEVDLGRVMECNCSHCERKGFLLTFTPIEKFRLLSGEEKLCDYRFNKRRIAHQFCAVCGVQPFARGEDRDGRQMAAINVRCIDGIDLAALKPQKIDGRSF